MKNNAIPYKIIDSVHKSSSKAKGKPDINDCTFRTKIGYVKYSSKNQYNNRLNCGAERYMSVQVLIGSISQPFRKEYFPLV